MSALGLEIETNVRVGFFPRRGEPAAGEKFLGCFSPEGGQPAAGENFWGCFSAAKKKVGAAFEPYFDL